MHLQNYTKEFRTNINLALPVIMGSLGHILVGLADDMMVGVIGPVHLAATSLGNSLVFIAMSIGIGFSIVLTPLISEADGAGELEEGRAIFHHGMILNTIISIILLAILLFAKPILLYLKQPPEVVSLALPYYTIVSFSMIPMMLFQGLKQFSDGMSRTKYAMRATIIANVINIFINFLLIYGVWFFPRLEIVGAALGTLISRVFMLVILYFMLKRVELFKYFFTGFSWHKVNKTYFSKIINLGLPSALQILFEVAAFVAAVLLAGVLGAYPQAANQIALKLASTTFMVAVGVGVAATVRIGNQKGKADFINLRRIAFSNQLLISMIMFGFSIIFLIFRNYLPYGFTQEIDVIKIAAQLLIIAAFFQISDGLQAVILASLRGIQDVWIPSLITFTAYWIIGFPLSYYLGLYTEYQTLGIWLGLFFGLSTSAFLLFLRFNQQTKKLIREANAAT